MSNQNEAVREFLKTQGRGFVPGDHVWVTMWVPVDQDCPCCNGTGEMPSRMEGNDRKYNCGVCNGTKRMPATAECVVSEGIVSGVEVNLSEYKPLPNKEEVDNLSVGYHVRSVEGWMSNKAGWVNWAKSHHSNSEYLFETKEKAEAMRDYMIKQQIGKAASMERINSVSPKEFTEYYMNEHYGDTKKDD